MEDILNNIPTILLSALAMLGMSGLTLFLARRTGLTDVQVAVKTETALLISAQGERIELLEAKVNELTSQVQLLERQAARDKKEISRLRKIIADNFNSVIGGKT